MWTYRYSVSNELCHFGIPGMRWGRRKARPTYNGPSRAGIRSAKMQYKQQKKDYKKSEEYKQIKKQRAKKAAVAGAAIAATALAAYGAYKLNKVMQNKKAIEAGARRVKEMTYANNALAERARNAMKISRSGSISNEFGGRISWG